MDLRSCQQIKSSRGDDYDLRTFRGVALPLQMISASARFPVRRILIVPCQQSLE